MKIITFKISELNQDTACVTEIKRVLFSTEVLGSSACLRCDFTVSQDKLMRYGFH